jgi:hypothetical protein
MASREEGGSRQQVSQLLAAWTTGYQAARDELLPVVYAELREDRGQAFQAASLTASLSDI